MNRYSVYTLFFILTFFELDAQDPQFSQYYSAPLYINPAFAGTSECSRFAVNYRNQWSRLPGEFNTIAASYDHNFAEYNSGLGILFTGDQAGQAKLRSITARVQYSYQVDINSQWSARGGLEAAYVRRSINFAGLTFGDQLSDSGPIPGKTTDDIFKNKRSINYADFSAGTIIFNKNLWVGFSAHHLSKPNQSFEESNQSKLPIRYSFHSGYKIILNNNTLGKRNPNYRERKIKEISLSPTFLYKSQGKFDQLDIGMYYTYEPILVGLWYRGLHPIKQYDAGYNNHDAIIAQVGYEYEDFSFAYSYDLTVSELTPSSGGSHELSITYLVCFKSYPKENRKKNKLPCPSFHKN